MLSLNVPPFFQSVHPNIKKAVRLLQLGQFRYALDELERMIADDSDAALYQYLKIELEHRLSGLGADPIVTLIWQVGPSAWESDWLRYLLRGAYQDEIIDRHYRHNTRYMIVVDAQLDKAKESYYKEAFEAGCRIFLIHLSDEAFRDDLSAYRWCSMVYRNYWSPLLETHSSIRAFPLGGKLGVKIDQEVPPASVRTSVWGFAGDTSKSGRRLMREAMSAIIGGRVHPTSGFNATDSLNVTDYQSFLRDCVFAPCPGGFVNLDTFRVYEALECGAVPIVEKRSGFDYFKLMLGDHPLPTIASWNEAPALIQDTLADDGGVRLQADCIQWWSDAKLRLKLQISDDIRRRLLGLPSSNNG